MQLGYPSSVSVPTSGCEGGQRAPRPSHIINFPQTITAEWVHVEMDRLDQSEHRAAITQDEWEYAQGGSPMVP
jgi:hypothetical protein